MNKASTSNDQYHTGDSSAGDPAQFGSPYIGSGDKMSIMAQGWYCPRCHRVNNPSLMQCICNPDNHTYATQVIGSPIDEETAKQYVDWTDPKSALMWSNLQREIKLPGLFEPDNEEL